MSLKTAHKLDAKWRSDDVKAEEIIDFSTFCLKPLILKGLKKAGFRTPSPVQLKAIPYAIFGEDLIVQAKSGTGKTCVFAIAALEILVDSPTLQVLILAPTREIAVQICNVINAIGSQIPKLVCNMFIGGTPLAEDHKKLVNCQIAVGSIGRVKQLIELGSMTVGCVRLFVLDEADNMMSFSFTEDLNYICNRLPESKQVLALSATYPPTLLECVKKIMRKPKLIRIDDKELALKGVLQFYQVIRYHPINNIVYQSKFRALLEILDKISFSQCLVYCRSIARVDNVCEQLNKSGHAAAKISSGDNQEMRLTAMNMLKEFQCRIMVSSDLTARGIDAEYVDMVINLDMPETLETYLHRIGRAGRYGSKAISITFVSTGQEEQKLGLYEQEGMFEVNPLPDPLPWDLLKWSTEMIKSAKTMPKKRSITEFMSMPSLCGPSESGKEMTSDNSTDASQGTNGNHTETVNGNNKINGRKNGTLPSFDSSSSSSDSSDSDTESDHYEERKKEQNAGVSSRPRLSSECDDTGAFADAIEEEFGDALETAPGNCEESSSSSAGVSCPPVDAAVVAIHSPEPETQEIQSFSDYGSHLLCPLTEENEELDSSSRSSSVVPADGKNESLQADSLNDQKAVLVSSEPEPAIINECLTTEISAVMYNNIFCEAGKASPIETSNVDITSQECIDKTEFIPEKANVLFSSIAPSTSSISESEVIEVLHDLFSKEIPSSGYICPSYEDLQGSFKASAENVTECNIPNPSFSSSIDRMDQNRLGLIAEYLTDKKIKHSRHISEVLNSNYSVEHVLGDGNSQPVIGARSLESRGKPSQNESSVKNSEAELTHNDSLNGAKSPEKSPENKGKKLSLGVDGSKGKKVSPENVGEIADSDKEVRIVLYSRNEKDARLTKGKTVGKKAPVPKTKVNTKDNVKKVDVAKSSAEHGVKSEKPKPCEPNICDIGAEKDPKTSWKNSQQSEYLSKYEEKKQSPSLSNNMHIENQNRKVLEKAEREKEISKHEDVAQLHDLPKRFTRNKFPKSSKSKLQNIQCSENLRSEEAKDRKSVQPDALHSRHGKVASRRRHQEGRRRGSSRSDEGVSDVSHKNFHMQRAYMGHDELIAKDHYRKHEGSYSVQSLRLCEDCDYDVYRSASCRSLGMKGSPLLCACFKYKVHPCQYDTGIDSCSRRRCGSHSLASRDHCCGCPHNPAFHPARHGVMDLLLNCASHRFCCEHSHAEESCCLLSGRHSVPESLQGPLRCSFEKRSYYENDEGVALHDNFMDYLYGKRPHW